MILVIDVDGVLADFITAFTTLANEMFGTPVRRPHEQLTWASFLLIEDQPGIGKPLTAAQRDAVWQALNADPLFLYRLEPLATEEELGRLGTTLGELYFVTSRVARAAKQQTEDWLARWVPGLVYPTVVRTSDKAAVARAVRADVAIDDSPEHVQALSAVCTAVVRDWPYNRDVPATIPRVASFGAFLDFVDARR